MEGDNSKMSNFSTIIKIDSHNSITLTEESYKDNKESNTTKIIMNINSDNPIPSLLNDIIRRDHIYSVIIINLIPHYGSGYYNITPFINNNGLISIRIDIYRSDDTINSVFDKKTKVHRFPFYYEDVGLEEAFLIRKDNSFINKIFGFRFKLKKQSVVLLAYPNIDDAMKHIMRHIIDKFEFRELNSSSIYSISQMFDPYSNIIHPVYAQAIRSGKSTSRDEFIEFRFLFVPDHLSYFVNLGRGLQISDCVCGISLNESTHKKIAVDNNSKNIKVHCEMKLEIHHTCPESIKNALFKRNEVESYSLATKFLNFYYSDWGCNYDGKVSNKYPLIIPVIVSNEPIEIVNEKESNYIRLSFDYQLVVFANSKFNIRFIKYLKKKGMPISDDLIFYRINPNDDRFRLYRSARMIGKEEEYVKIGIIKNEDIHDVSDIISSVICKYYDVGNYVPSGIILHNEKCEFIFESIWSAKNMDKYPAFKKEK